MDILRKLLHLPSPYLEVEDKVNPMATQDKLIEAEVWTKQKRNEVDELRRELLRYELDLQSEHVGSPKRRHR